MDNLIDYLRSFCFETVCIRLFLAFLMGGLIGLERGKRGRAAGFRTHILVCIGSALTTLTGIFAIEMLSYSTDPLRIGAQVVSGIGFLGAGTILVTGRFHITGLTTAAGLWNTAAIGLALGIGFYEGAFICMIISVISMVILNNFDSAITGSKKNIEIYIEITNANDVNSIVDVLTGSVYGASHVEIKPARSAIASNLGIECTINAKSDEIKKKLISSISNMENVAFAIESV